MGGFQTTALDSSEIEPSASGGYGDEAIADAIRHELREDAATTDLDINVHVRNGVVHLRSRVPNLVDSDNAEAVAYLSPASLRW